MTNFASRTPPRSTVSRNGLGALWKSASSIVSLGVLAVGVALGCSSADTALPDSGALAGNGAEASTPPCIEGDTRGCALTLDATAEKLTCYEGTKTCVDGTWGECTDGTIVERPAPTPAALERLRSQALGVPWERCTPEPVSGAAGASGAAAATPTPFNNPCDPECHFQFTEPGVPPGANSNPLTGGDRGDVLGLFPLLPTPPTCGSGADCQINSHCSDPATGATCTHPKCTAGAPLASACDTCVADVCATAAGSYCCDGADPRGWDAGCVDLVGTVCGSPCSTATSLCAHEPCFQGAALVSTCDPCVTDICAVAATSYCCDAADPRGWDADCVLGVITVCGGGSFITPTCTDLIQSGFETDVDCGGASCAPCTVGGSCLVGSDCDSDVCTGLTCQPALCTDTVRNATETDVDCGGGTCPSCGDGLRCTVGSDCQSQVCETNLCRPANCWDGVANGTETDADCGGSGCGACEDGKACLATSDCQSGVCASNVCQTPTCTDAVQNGHETDVNCGGVDCAGCPDGMRCLADDDCANAWCDNGVCDTPSCTDGLQNGTETDADCGGACGSSCAEGQACAGDGDCETNHCQDSACAPTCSDGLQNQDESDVDCGGDSCAARCADGQTCTIWTDCASEGCAGGICATLPPSCTDGHQNGLETDDDCGGADCGATCSIGQACLADSDCMGNSCQAGFCAPSCTDGMKNSTETDVDCGGGCVPAKRCAIGEQCVVDGDCSSNKCVGGFCAESCSDGIRNQDETDTDCGGGACGATCTVGKVCKNSADCLDNNCGNNGLCKAPYQLCDFTMLATDSLTSNGRFGVTGRVGTKSLSLTSSNSARRYTFNDLVVTDNTELRYGNTIANTDNDPDYAGDVTIGGSLVLNNFTVAGTTSSGNAVTLPSIPSITGLSCSPSGSVTYSNGTCFGGDTCSSSGSYYNVVAAAANVANKNVTIDDGNTASPYVQVVLPPGNYGDLVVANWNHVELQAGNYTFRSITIPFGQINMPASGFVNIALCGKFWAGELGRARLTGKDTIASGGTNVITSAHDARRFRLYSDYVSSSDPLDAAILFDGQGPWGGFFSAPKGTIRIKSDAEVAGYLYAKRIVTNSGDAVTGYYNDCVEHLQIASNYVDASGVGPSWVYDWKQWASAGPPIAYNDVSCRAWYKTWGSFGTWPTFLGYTSEASPTTSLVGPPLTRNDCMEAFNASKFPLTASFEVPAPATSPLLHEPTDEAAALEYAAVDSAPDGDVASYFSAAEPTPADWPASFTETAPEPGAGASPPSGSLAAAAPPAFAGDGIPLLDAASYGPLAEYVVPAATLGASSPLALAGVGGAAGWDAAEQSWAQSTGGYWGPNAVDGALCKYTLYSNGDMILDNVNVNATMAVYGNVTFQNVENVIHGTLEASGWVSLAGGAGLHGSVIAGGKVDVLNEGFIVKEPSAAFAIWTHTGLVTVGDGNGYVDGLVKTNGGFRNNNGGKLLNPSSPAVPNNTTVYAGAGINNPVASPSAPTLPGAPPAPPAVSCPGTGGGVSPGGGATATIAPGDYAGVYITSNATLQLSSGNYTFTDFYTSADAKLIYDLSGGPIKVTVCGGFGLSNKLHITPIATADPLAVRWDVRAGGSFVIDGGDCTTDCGWLGVLSAPNAWVEVRQGVKFRGMLHSKGMRLTKTVITENISQNAACDFNPTPTCTDGIKNGTETAIDCGGASCPKCADSKTCIVGGDCQSGVCSGGVCKTPTCTDGVKNGTETDVDCGGSCPDCADNKLCLSSGDCQSNVCSSNKCQAPTCTDGAKNGTETDVDCGGSCPDCANGKVCSVSGDCVSGVCTGGVCQNPTCTDGVKNGTETDVDCGGASCADCATGKTCVAGGDCVSGVCASNKCQVPSCTDGVKNGAETGTDCGGATSCDRCPTGTNNCTSGTDCQSSVCSGTNCVAPTCFDGVKNGTETDQDCGGSCAAKCNVSKACVTASDCVTNVCTNGICAVPSAASCNNGTKDGNETAIDCGGADCPKCNSGSTCLAATDCSSGVCSTTCQAPTCTDGVQNGTETALDCGGVCTTKCADAQPCAVAADCQSSVCVGGICQAASCTDGAKNGAETDKDCGGPTCPDCADGKACASSGDCLSAVCSPLPGICQVASCNDGVKNGNETAIDCGGPTCPDCSTGSACGAGSDCVSGVCAGNLCQAATCTDGVKNGAETDTDCGGPTCPDCAVGQLCSVGTDCAAGVCLAGSCQAPNCSDGAKNGSETDVDCGGPTCPDCANGLACGADGDCVSGVCSVTCQVPNCLDGVRNGLETDVDCGGPTCPDCADGKLCADAGDCTSTWCDAGTCETPTCTDGIQNGTETDVDCGGATCGPCEHDEQCLVNADCISNECTVGWCIATCTDGVLNNGETDIDCGGSACPACAEGDDCLVDVDCATGTCTAYVCVDPPPSCTDGILNNLETDVDCGGPNCGSTCLTGEICDTVIDCAPVALGTLACQDDPATAGTERLCVALPPAVPVCSYSTVSSGSSCEPWMLGEKEPTCVGDIDLAVDVPCLDSSLHGLIPVCNHGQDVAPAGATIHFFAYPGSVSEWGLDNPSGELATPAPCVTSDAIDPGSCIQVDCGAFADDGSQYLLMVNPSSDAYSDECYHRDNWSVFLADSSVATCQPIGCSVEEADDSLGDPISVAVVGGASLNLAMAEVVWTSSAGVATAIPYDAGCGADGWCFDDPAAPTRVDVGANVAADIAADTGAGTTLRAEIGCVREYLDTVLPVEQYDAAECDPSQRIQWQFFTWDAYTPADSEIQFQLRSCADAAASDCTPWVDLDADLPVGARVKATANDVDGEDRSRCALIDSLTDPRCPVVLDNFLERGHPYVEMQATIYPRSSLYESPRLYEWGITHTCVDDE